MALIWRRASSASSMPRSSNWRPWAARVLRASSSEASRSALGDEDWRSPSACSTAWRRTRPCRRCSIEDWYSDPPIMNALDGQIGAGVQRRLRQRGMEAEVRTVGLVHHERDACSVGHAGHRLQVAAEAVVARRGDVHRDRVGMPVEGRLNAGKRSRQGQARRRVERRWDIDGLGAGEEQRREHGAMGGAGHDDLVAGLGHAQQGGLVPHTGAVDQEEAGVRPKSLRRQGLGLAQRALGRFEIVHPRHLRQVRPEEGVAPLLSQPRCGRAGVLVARHVERGPLQRCPPNEVFGERGARLVQARWLPPTVRPRPFRTPRRPRCRRRCRIFQSCRPGRP